MGGYIQQQPTSMFSSPHSQFNAGNLAAAPIFDGADYAADDGWVNGNGNAVGANNGWANPADDGW